MNISSRTPEGIPEHCPVCGQEVVCEPSDPPGDAPCSPCGHLVWFTGQAGGDGLMVRFSTEMMFDASEIEGVRGQLSRGEMRSERLLLDFARVAFIGSRALTELIRLYKGVKEAGGNLKLCNVRPEICQLFRLMRLDGLFEIQEA
jgi:anti-sigma B factor antagonist